MAGFNWTLGKGKYSLGDYRFQIDPTTKNEGKDILLPQVYMRGLGAGGEVQTWEGSYSDNTQTFTWNTMPPEMYDSLDYYKQQAILDRSKTFTFTYNDTGEIWTIQFISLDGEKLAGVYYSVSLVIRLLEIVA